MQVVITPEQVRSCSASTLSKDGVLESFPDGVPVDLRSYDMLLHRAMPALSLFIGTLEPKDRYDFGKYLLWQARPYLMSALEGAGMATEVCLVRDTSLYSESDIAKTLDILGMVESKAAWVFERSQEKITDTIYDVDGTWPAQWRHKENAKRAYVLVYRSTFVCEWLTHSRKGHPYIDLSLSLISCDKVNAREAEITAREQAAWIIRRLAYRESLSADNTDSERQISDDFPYTEEEIIAMPIERVQACLTDAGIDLHTAKAVLNNLLEVAREQKA